MIDTVTRSAVFAAYQLTVLLGILLLPVALLARRLGVRLPLGRAVERLGERYERLALRGTR